MATKFFYNENENVRVPKLNAVVGSDTVSTSVLYKSNLPNTYARGISALKQFGADDADGVSLIHFIPPAFDDVLMDGTNSTDLQPYMANAVAALSAISTRKRLLIPALTYKINTQLNIDVDDLVIDAQGATFSYPGTAGIGLIHLEGNNIRVNGLHFYQEQDAPFHPWAFNVEGQDCHLDECFVEKFEGAGGYQFYIRPGADGFRCTNCRTKGGNGVFVGASNASFINNKFIASATGGDDGVAIHSGSGDSIENVRVIGNYFENHTDFVAIGTAIGTPGADDPDHTNGVRGVVVMGNEGKNCNMILYIKPGSETADYRDGYVEDVTCSNNVLQDLTGAKLGRGVGIQASRGQWVKGVRGDKNFITGRVNNTESNGHKKGLDIFTFMSATGGAPLVSDIDVEIIYNDPYDGAAFGTAGVAGYPMVNFVNIEDDAGSSIAAPINIRVRGNGCSESGVKVSSGLDSVVSIEKAILDNVATGGGVNQAGVRADSVVRITGEVRMGTIGGTGKAFHTVGSTGRAFPASAPPGGLQISFVDGLPTASQLLWRGVAERDMWLSTVSGTSDVAATATATFTLKLGSTSIATAQWAAAGTVATGSITTNSIPAGSKLYLYAPSSQDATLANGTIILSFNPK